MTFWSRSSENEEEERRRDKWIEIRWGESERLSWRLHCSEKSLESFFEEDHHGYLPDVAPFSTSVLRSNRVNSAPAGPRTPPWTPQSNTLEVLWHLVHKTSEALVQCITMKVIWKFWAMRPTQALSQLSLLIKPSSGGESMGGRHDNLYSVRANINSLGGAYINMI